MNLWVRRLLIANVVVFAFTEFLAPQIRPYLAFYPRFALTMPWGWVTHMFVHGGFGHIFWNMLGLWMFGSRVESRLTSRHFIRMYLVAGLTGALFSLVLSPEASIVGASGALYGVMICYAAFWPRERIYIYGILPVEAWLLVVLFTMFDLFSGVGQLQDGIAHFAHLGGFAGGYIYLTLLERNSPSRRFRDKVDKVAPSTNKALKDGWKNVNLDNVHQLSRDEVNRILDKISLTGYGSLTEQEKLFLSNFVPPDDRKNWTQ